MPSTLSRFIPHLVGEFPKQFMELYENLNIPSGDEKEEVKHLLWEAFDFGLNSHEGQKTQIGRTLF